MVAYGVSHSSAKAEYGGVANTVAECIWLHQLLDELLCSIKQATLVFLLQCLPAVYMSTNPVHHKRTKHIELDVQLDDIHVLHVPTNEQYTRVKDISTRVLT